MSKLSRFKKAPAIKLPKLPPSSRLNEDSSDDDDFVSPPFKFREAKKKASPTPPSKPSSLDSSVSEYFPRSSSKSRTRSTSRESKEALPEDQVTPTVTKTKVASRKEGNQVKNLGDFSKDSETKTKGTTKKENVQNSNSPEKLLQSLPDENDNDNDCEGQGKVQCPFCWKKLGDKLTGTTHIKACAKGVPIQQVIDAMQLQEKQIQEWEKLGIAFPGFSSNVAPKKTRGGRGKGGGGSTRKKKEEEADPQLELAVALSMSLHEEIESRQAKENQFLIENGLDKEIELVEIKSAPVVPVQVSEESQIARTTNRISVPVTSVVGTRRRGRKIPANQLPLYTVDNERKKSIICNRVTKIIDESEKDKNQEFYVREQISSDNFGVPKRLMQFHDKESTLWSRAQGALEIPDESFSVLEYPDPKQQLEMIPEPNTGEVNTESSTSLGYCNRDYLKSSPDSKNGEIVNEKSLPKPAPVKVEKPNNGKLKKIEMTVTRERKYSSKESIASESMEALRKLPSPIQDITKMLLAKRECDMAIYGREEKALRCHRFMISARCPKLLDEVADEEHDGKTRQVVLLTDFSNKTLKAFLWYIYTGNLDAVREEDMVEELKELASLYDLPVDDQKECQPKVGTIPTCCVSVQTNAISTHNVSTMTETMDRSSIETGFESSEVVESQELFTTIIEGQEPSTVIECKSEIGINARVSSPNSIPQDASWSEDILSDGDLFEDIESEMKVDTLPQPSTPPSDLGADISISTKEPKSVAHSSSEDLFVDEDYLQDLASPVTQWKPSEKKRSRSPLMDNSGGLYSATQVANMLEMRKEWRDSDELRNKATKKQKLDNSYQMTSVTNKSRKSDFDMSDIKSDLDINVSGDSDTDMDRWEDDKIFSKIDSAIAITPKQNLLATPKNNLFKSRRSVSTPNLSINSPNNFANSPFYNPQISESDNECDPFAGVDDDSVFANIPDEILGVKKTPVTTRKSSSFGKDLGLSTSTSQRCLFPLPNTRRRLSPRDLSPHEPEDSLSTTKTIKGPKGGGRAKTKAKAPPKIKLPSRLPASKSGSNSNQHEFSSNVNGETTHRVTENTFLSQQPLRSNPSNEPSPGHSSKSPMLNYSLIDTPILKQELKKYGIKPLPRSKAKVLLRHIYKETHK